MTIVIKINIIDGRKNLVIVRLSYDFEVVVHMVIFFHSLFIVSDSAVS